MVGFLVFVYFSSKLNSTPAGVFWTAIFSSIIGSAITLLFSVIFDVIIVKRDNIINSEHPELPKARCPYDNIPCANKFPCHAPHIIAFENIRKAWEYVLDCLIETESNPKIDLLKIYAGRGREFLSQLNGLLAEPKYAKICIGEIQLLVKANNDNIFADKNRGIIDSIISKGEHGEVHTTVRYAELPNNPKGKKYHLTHYMCIIDDSFTIFGCNTGYQHDRDVVSNRPFIASYKTSAGRKLVLYQSENFDLILKINNLTLVSYTKCSNRFMMEP
jgi:hypothetical protein